MVAPPSILRLIKQRIWTKSIRKSHNENPLLSAGLAFVSPGGANHVSESTQIMDEGEAGCRSSLNIDVVERQSISTLTRRRRKITCSPHEIKHTADTSRPYGFMCRRMNDIIPLVMTLVLTDTLLLKVYGHINKSWIKSSILCCIHFLNVH